MGDFNQKAIRTITDIDTLIVSTPEICGGRPRIAEHRIMVHNIVINFNASRKAEDIVAERPHYAALTYYYANKKVLNPERFTSSEVMIFQRISC
jgi:uncharacterized protein (DUF433 family)